MNSMAANIDGLTIHSWGEIGFKDKNGNMCKPRRKDDRDEGPTMNAKCASLRWILVDEIEATGCELLTDLNDNVCKHASDASRYKRAQPSGELRPFGGINVLFIGDFWQIPPVGQVAIMGNPYSAGAMQSAKANAGRAKDVHFGIVWQYPSQIERYYPTISPLPVQ